MAERRRDVRRLLPDDQRLSLMSFRSRRCRFVLVEPVTAARHACPGLLTNLLANGRLEGA
jgi:hypothetical protein